MVPNQLSYGRTAVIVTQDSHQYNTTEHSMSTRSDRGMKVAIVLLVVGGTLSTIGSGMRFYRHAIEEGRAQVVLGKVECVVLNETVLCEPKQKTITD